MDDRIERDTSKKARGRIAQSIGSPSVRTLMNAQRENENKELNQSKKKGLVHARLDGSTLRLHSMIASESFATLCALAENGRLETRLSSSKEVFL